MTLPYQQEEEPYGKSSAPLLEPPVIYAAASSTVGQQASINHFDNNASYNANEENPNSTKIIRVGSILLFVGTAIVTMFLLADFVAGTIYYTSTRYPNGSPRNAPAVSFVKFPLLALNAILLIMSGVFGVLSTKNDSTRTARFSLLHVVFLSLGMLVFVWEFIFIYVSFFTTGYEFNTYSHGYHFIPFLVIFSLFSFIGVLCCGICCVSGVVRLRNIDLNIKETSI